MRALMLAVLLVLLDQGLWAQEDSSDYSSQATLSLHDTVIIPSAHDWSDWISPQFLTFLTLESWQEYKADTLARRYIRWTGASLIFVGVKPGLNLANYYIQPDTTWAIAQPTLEGWMDWLERKRAEH